MQQRLQFVEHGAHAAGCMEVLHVMLPGRFQVDEHGSRLAKRVEMPQVNRQTDPACNGGKVNDGIRRTANRQQHAQRVLDRLTGHDSLRRDTRGRELYRSRPRGFGKTQAICVNGGNGSAARKAHAERFGKTRHRARGAHHRARARGHGEVVLDAVDFGAADLSRAVSRPEPAAIGTCAEALTAVTPGHHRSDDELDGGYPCRDRAHQLRRNRLVAAADEHDRAHGLRANHLLDVHRHQIAEHEARGIEKHLSQGDRGEFQREPARAQHAALDGFDELRRQPMTVIESARGGGNADDRDA